MRQMLSASSEIELWSVDLGDDRWDDFAAVLDSREQARFARIIAPAAQTEQRRCRIALRLILGQRLGLAQQQVPLAYGPFRKPSVVGLPLEFNVSHSAGRGLIGLARKPLGVDLERVVARGSEIDALLRMIAHPHELAVARERPPSEQESFFYRLWTRKEAYTKALGHGLSKELTQFWIAPSVRGGQVVDPAEPFAPRYLVDVEVEAGWVASLCCDNMVPRLTRRGSAGEIDDLLRSAASHMPKNNRACALR